LLARRHAAERGHRIDARIEQDVGKQLSLRELLPKERRRRGVRQRGSKFVEAEVEIVGQLDAVRARLVAERTCRLPQT